MKVRTEKKNIFIFKFCHFAIMVRDSVSCSVTKSQGQIGQWEENLERLQVYNHFWGFFHSKIFVQLYICISLGWAVPAAVLHGLAAERRAAEPQGGLIERR